MQSFLNSRRDEAVQNAKEPDSFDNKALAIQRDAALARARQLEQQNTRLREALERISRPPNGNYAQFLARSALSEADGPDVPYPTN